MVAVRVQTFQGVAPKVPARYLADGQAQTALNCPVFNGSLQPLLDTGSTLLTLDKVGTPQTIYRYGQDTISDTQYWFHWLDDVDVCRSQIAGDTSEWTFYTGDGVPKATYSALALTGTNYPANARRLGLPAPTIAASVAAGSATSGTTVAKVTLTATVLNLLATEDLDISTTTDDDVEYTTVSPASSDPTTVANAINASAAAVSATADDVFNTVLIESDAAGADAVLFVRYTDPDVLDTSGALNLDVSPNLSASGTADTTAPYIVLEDDEIGSIANGDTLSIGTETSTVFTDLAAAGAHTPASLASLINTNAAGKVVATVYGSCVVISPGTEGSGASGAIQYIRKNSSATTISDTTVTGSEAPAPAELFIVDSDLSGADGQYMQLTVNSILYTAKASDPAVITDLDRFSLQNVEIEYYGSIEPFAIVRTDALGSNTSLNFRVGSYGAAQIVLSDSGTTQSETPETRVYTYTWVSKESGFEFESAPAPASSDITVDATQSVTLSSFDSVPAGLYNVTHKRIYRSVSGVYLYVGETTAAAATFDDSVAADALGEELPSLLWTEPPDDLAGLINLPNGMMAGFVGRDVYFCEPYRPHAWPESYIQTVDYPVVGLGRMDTTVAVMTTGNPYLMQGSSPDSIAVVKSDLDQACVSKRSIVSFGSSVVYAAPDGLMMLSPSGSQIITADLFDYQQWQAYFKPETIHAYRHDNKYIGFYDNGVTQGGFILDMPTRQFILHDIYATAGFQDVQRDKLFLAFSDQTVKDWYGGSAKSYIWRSKKFTMPQTMSFTCAQLEAESYPMTMTIIADGVTKLTKTVTSRDPFRLPSGVGRDWEFQIEGSYEVFSAALATSPTELANG